MSKPRVQIGDRYFRWRKGRLVEIPPQWVGQVTHPQTIRKRPSKKGQGRKFKRKCVR